MTSHEALSAALLWLRNHYDVGDRRQKKAVLRKVDALIDLYPVSAHAYEKFVDWKPGDPVEIKVCYCPPDQCLAPKPQWCVGRRKCDMK